MALAPSFPPSVPPSDDCNSRDYTQTVEAFVLLAVLALFLLHILGSLRRQSGHGLLHAIVMGVNTLSYPLVSYTIGRMESSDWYYDDFAVWAVFLLLLLGSTDNLTACRLSDIDNWKSIFVKHLFKGFLLLYVVVTYGRKMKYLLPPLSAIVLVGVLKWYVRITSIRMVSKSCLWKNVKVIADYMEHADNLLVACNPVTMDGYRYMVAGEKYWMKRPAGHAPLYRADSSKVITVEKVWQCTGNLLLRERGNKLKDVCLSMALSKMLNRRFAGFNLSEAELEKTHDFVFRGLLVAGDNPYQRAFMVIEEELVFIHDIYYTRYSYLYQKGRYLCLCFPVVMIGLCLWVVLIDLHVDHECDRNPNDEWNANCYQLGYRTIFIMVALAFLEAYQLYLNIASGWFKVALIRSYVSTPFLQRNGCSLDMIIGLVLRLKAFPHGRTNLKKAKKGRNNSVKLSENLKKAIVDSLLGSNGRLTNGITSLRNNGVDAHLSWACYATATADGSVTRTILVWHIATTLCEYQLDPNLNKEDNVITACTLSQYCMHLLTFAPHLLPDHISISESLLDQSINEARQRITEAGAKTIEDRCDVLMKISTHDDNLVAEGLLVARGAWLARYLIEHIQEPTLRWKVLSDFWAEMMLYVSPSDNARAHLEALAMGGEFITHLWALLTHAATSMPHRTNLFISELLSLKPPRPTAWIVADDFNLTCSPLDRNTPGFHWALTSRINALINILALIELKWLECLYTWSNKCSSPTLAWLDRASINNTFCDVFPNSTLTRAWVRHLTIFPSSSLFLPSFQTSFSLRTIG
ncbi:unnamed protein product [Miscanthus lutarioriparius]|uniref:DUF4220 domain-containing protein n=1 Tax=Miscanthus lutarioriparius TaxID=422564 RepID=A0A811QDM9_9POAL|nr:unnamed protein product [Miscanthus lutarioriparius]